MQNRIISSGKGMDAIDALMCFGYKLICTEGRYHLEHCIVAGRYYESTRLLFGEIGQQPEYYLELFQQKGLAHGS